MSEADCARLSTIWRGIQVVCAFGSLFIWFYNVNELIGGDSARGMRMWVVATGLAVMIAIGLPYWTRSAAKLRSNSKEDKAEPEGAGSTSSDTSLSGVSVSKRRDKFIGGSFAIGMAYIQPIGASLESSSWAVFVAFSLTYGVWAVFAFKAWTRLEA